MSHSIGHKSQLDSLRFLAVLSVFLYHNGLHPSRMSFPYGYHGVDVFFALSGFLITRLILLSEQGQPLRDLGIFYIRRILRIFPLYYAVLGVLLYLHCLPNPLWNFLYIWNFKLYFDHNWHGYLAHFWSLCVEEQFYLTFPPILLLTPQKWRVGMISGLLFASFICGCIWSSVEPNSFYFILLPVRGQVLLMGCLLGLLELKKFTEKFNGTALLAIGVLIYSYYLQPGYANTHYAGTIIKDLGLATIVFGLWRTENKYVLAVFRFPLLVYLGRISYGLYVFHLLSWPLVEWLGKFYPALSKIDQTLSTGLVTIILSMLTWHLLEAPFNSLKKFFPYLKEGAEGLQQSIVKIESAGAAEQQELSVEQTKPSFESQDQ